MLNLVFLGSVMRVCAKFRVPSHSSVINEILYELFAAKKCTCNYSMTSQGLLLLSDAKLLSQGIDNNGKAHGISVHIAYVQMPTINAHAAKPV